MSVRGATDGTPDSRTEAKIKFDLVAISRLRLGTSVMLNGARFEAEAYAAAQLIRDHVARLADESELPRLAHALRHNSEPPALRGV